jgi:hypothetical protein
VQTWEHRPKEDLNNLPAALRVQTEGSDVVGVMEHPPAQQPRRFVKL